MNGRRIWVKDVIRFEEGVYLLPKNPPEGKKVNAVWSLDPKADELVEKYFGGYENTIPAEYGIVMGDAGCSWIEPFTSPEEALQWIKENASHIYFGKWTNPQLREMFPEIPIQSHPKEIEDNFNDEDMQKDGGTGMEL